MHVYHFYYIFLSFFHALCKSKYLIIILIYSGQGQAIFEDEFLKIERNCLQAIVKMFMNSVKMC